MSSVRNHGLFFLSNIPYYISMLYVIIVSCDLIIVCRSVFISSFHQKTCVMLFIPIISQIIYIHLYILCFQICFVKRTNHILLAKIRSYQKPESDRIQPPANVARRNLISIRYHFRIGHFRSNLRHLHSRSSILQIFTAKF